MHKNNNTQQLQLVVIAGPNGSGKSTLETTLSVHGPLKIMQKAKELNYHITLAYVGIESPKHAITRVQERVQQGGHDIPIPDILRRYERSMNNLPLAMQLANVTLIFDNSQAKHVLHLFIDHREGIIKEIYQPLFPVWLIYRLMKYLSIIKDELIIKTLGKPAESTDTINLFLHSYPHEWENLRGMDDKSLKTMLTFYDLAQIETDPRKLQFIHQCLMNLAVILTSKRIFEIIKKIAPHLAKKMQQCLGTL